ncbi:hypothetical protein EOL70_12260 [Leucothrix sargassi]|nr:hypothetical protein EOL70_12260 [Leucothrix sargassi]
MDNKAHTILVSIMASYGTRLTASTANCKAFLADFMVDYPAEKNVLIHLHRQDLPQTLAALKNDTIDKKTALDFIDHVSARGEIEMHDLAWAVDAWANAMELDIKTRRMIRKHCFSNAVRDLHIVTIQATQAATEAAPEVPAIVLESANQAAFPRVAILGVATLVSTFSLFQALKTMLPTDEPTQATPAPVVQNVVTEKAPLPKLVVLKSPEKAPAPVTPAEEVAITPIDIDKLSGRLSHVQEVAEVIEPAVDVAEADVKTDSLLHADIEAFLTQD